MMRAWADSTAARAASEEATAASYCCCDTSSLASSGFSRSRSRAVLVAFAVASLRRACADASRARDASTSRADASVPVVARSTFAPAELTWLAVVVDVIEMPASAAASAACASA